VTDAGWQVLQEELGVTASGSADEIAMSIGEYLAVPSGTLKYYHNDNFNSPLASGSSAPDVMIVCPCTMGTLARIASGHSGNLLERCADVMLKEKRPLILVPRETPLNEIHLENMLKLARLGARIVPAMPAFYQKPQTIEDLVAFMASKALDAAGIANDLYPRWDMHADSEPVTG
jgi:4-hydroxy-3-polyprenylbenzoate decarboxylase